MTHRAEPQPMSEDAAPAVPLTCARAGSRVRVAWLSGGRGLQGRLAALGVFPGSEILVVKDSLSLPGPVIIQRGQDRLVLGRGMASRLYVRM